MVEYSTISTLEYLKDTLANMVLNESWLEYDLNDVTQMENKIICESNWIKQMSQIDSETISQIGSETASQIRSETVIRIKLEMVASAELLMSMTAPAANTWQLLTRQRCACSNCDVDGVTVP